MIQTVFSLNAIAMLGWVLMMLLPSWRVTRVVANWAVFPIYLAVLYTIGIMIAIGDGGLGFVRDFSSAGGVIRLLSSPDFALLLWLHVLCFDQAVGHYVYCDNMIHRYMPLPIQSVILFFILMFGPFGFACYVLIRAYRKRAKALN